MTDDEFNRLIADLISISILYIAEDAPKTREVMEKAIEELKRLKMKENSDD